MGAAVNAGPAYVGNVGGAVVDFTALGDTVNAAGASSKRPREGVARSRPESQTISWRMGRDGSWRSAAATGR